MPLAVYLSARDDRGSGNALKMDVIWLNLGPSFIPSAVYGKKLSLHRPRMKGDPSKRLSDPSF
jgi:hypothetical protein